MVSLPPTLPFIPAQPRPLRTHVAQELHEGGWSTSIARVFKTSDVEACKLCEVCTADKDTGLCLVVARRYVPDADCAMYRAADQTATG